MGAPPRAGTMAHLSAVYPESRKVLIWKRKEPSLGDQIRFLEEMLFRVRPEGCIGVNRVFWWSGGSGVGGIIVLTW